MQLLGGQEREALGQVKPHLAPEDAQGACAGPVATLHAIGQNVREQVQILPLRVVGRRKAKAGRRDGGVHQDTTLPIRRFSNSPIDAMHSLVHRLIRLVSLKSRRHPERHAPPPCWCAPATDCGAGSVQSGQ